MRKVLEGLEDLTCYDEFWLNKDMENMGYFFEYCGKYCQEILADNSFDLGAQLIRNLYLICLARGKVQVQNLNKLICKIRDIKKEEERILRRLRKRYDQFIIKT